MPRRRPPVVVYSIVALGSLIAAAAILRAQAGGSLALDNNCQLPELRSRAAAAPATSKVTGRYTDGVVVAYLAACHDSLAISPAHWSGVEYLERARGDSFTVPRRSNRTIVLERDVAGSATAIRTTGFGIPARLLRITPGQRTGVEALLAGAIAEAESLLAPSTDSGRRAVSVADQVSRLATKRGYAQALRSRMLERFGSTSAPLPPAPVRGDSGWVVPFALANLFAPPTPSERLTASKRIRERDRAVTNVSVLYTSYAMSGPDSFAVRIVSYLAGGLKSAGAVIVPVHPAPGCCAVLIDVKGTNPGYSPLDLTDGPAILPLLGSAARSFVIAAPAIRGEAISIGTRTFTADGDRTDGWDGGADDAMAMLSAAGAVVPQADTMRACTYGRSRGGAVAMLAAARDARFKCVVAVSAPTDWFGAMWASGDRPERTIGNALAARARPEQDGGQFIERILAPVIAGRWSLADARVAMISSSPLYFTKTLPPLIAFYGAEDRQVPARNAAMLDSLLSTGAVRRVSPFRVIVTPAAGHDADPLLIAREVPRFLSKYLRTPIGRRYPGADAR